MARAREGDPVPVFAYSLDVQGKITGLFQEVSGLGSENDIIEQKSAASGVVMKVPGRLKWGDITLKRGITPSMDVWQWRAEVEKGDMKAARKNGSIFMLDRDAKPLAQWDFRDGWPSKVSGPALKTDSNEFGVEEITIVHEYIERVK